MVWQADRRLFLMSGLGASSLALMPEPARGAARSGRPNILFIMADDLGYADLGCYGHRHHQTPHIDTLARDGVMLRNGYANSAVCSASRMGLITGRYQYRVAAGLEEPLGMDEGLALPADQPNLASLMKRAGYRTSLIGKWHLGGSPLRCGYDSFYGIPGGATDYFKHGLTLPDGRVMGGLHDGDQPIRREGYITDIFGDRAVHELTALAGGGAPFFMSLHFTAPHWPWEGPGDAAVADSVGNMMHRDGGSLATYATMVRSLDDNVGKVLEALRMLGIDDNTIIVFTSDNGGERFSDTWPLIGAKTELLEGGIRVPLLVRWDRHIPAGSATGQVMILMDFLPTLLSAAGGRPDPAYPSDGLNLLPQLLGKSTPVPRKLYWRYKAMEQTAMRDGNWKWLRINGQEHLFDLGSDERERANLIEKYPEQLARMKADYATWNAQMLPYTEATSSYTLKYDNWADRY